MKWLLLLAVLSACGGDDEAPADPAQSAYCISVRKAWLADKQGADTYTQVSTAPKPQILADYRRRMDALWAQSPECFR